MPRRSSRLLFVHAHPDDETLATGIAMAHHVAAGDQVHLLTCTLGEEGEVITGDLRHLAADREDRLGPYRRRELREAMRVLGVHEQVLGEVGGAGSRYRDSGMAGTASTRDPRAFTRADAGQAGDLVRDVLREIRPDVVVTYDQHGGYGHPDHIQTHRVTRAAVAGTPRAQRPRLFCRLTPRSWAQADREWVRRHVTAREDPRVLLPGEADAYPAGVVQDEIVTHEVADPRVAPTRDRALREHLTQVRVYDGYYALSDDIAARLVDREGYALLDPDSGALYPLDGAGGPRPGLLG